MRKSTILSLALVLIISCAPVRYFTNYEGGHDPLFDLKSVKTIGFIPFCWTPWAKERGCDELAEKQLFVYARDELQKRGFEVFYISPEFLELDPDTSVHGIDIKANYDKTPDLTLSIYYWQGLGNVVHVPGQSGGAINWGNQNGVGYYGQTQGYDVQTCSLILGYFLWSGGRPKYRNKAWEGIVKKGSPKLDLFEQAHDLTTEIFLKKFDQ